MHKVFGEIENEKYYDRPGAYLIPVRDGKIAVVQTPKGYFLLGGGLEDGETNEAAIERECREEIGWSVQVRAYLASAEAYCRHPKVRFFHPVQYYYLGDLLEPVCPPVEQDHTLLWKSYEELRGSMFSEMQNWAISLAIQAGR